MCVQKNLRGDSSLLTREFRLLNSGDTNQLKLLSSLGFAKIAIRAGGLLTGTAGRCLGKLEGGR